MEPRLIIAYGIIALLVAVAASVIAVSVRKRRAEQRVMRGRHRPR